MKRRFMYLFLLITTLLVLTACSCEHQWTNASCDKPKTCALCSITEGKPAGHSWTDANCTAPKTCTGCGETEGAALGHSWIAATCEAPKTCMLCEETEGAALGHSWVDATCEIPKTCTLCAAAEGSATGHSWTDWARVETDACQTCTNCATENVISMTDYLVSQLQGRWISTKDMLDGDVPPNWFISLEIRADGTAGLYTPYGAYPSCKLEYTLPVHDLNRPFHEQIFGFTLTADTGETFHFDHIQEMGFMVGYQGFIYERESEEAAAVRELLQGKWIFNSFYAYDDALAGLDHSGYTVEFHEGNQFTVCAEEQFEGTWVYLPGDWSESGAVTYYSIITAIGEDYWSMYFTLEIHNDTGTVLLRTERPRAERTEFIKAK